MRDFVFSGFAVTKLIQYLDRWLFTRVAYTEAIIHPIVGQEGRYCPRK